MSKQKPVDVMSGFRNFWPQGTNGGTTKIKVNKKGKGAYNRNKNKRDGRSHYSGSDHLVYFYSPDKSAA